MTELLEVRDLTVEFDGDDGVVHAVNGVSLTVEAGQTLGLVGESGSGKSVTALAVMGLLPCPPARIVAGKVNFRGIDLLSDRDYQRRVRGREISMIYQNPLMSLNPVLTIGRQLTEVIRLHLGLAPEDAKCRAAELLELVGIPDAARSLSCYPHQFSGGQRQRILIAVALCCEPALLLADEPTTALDVTIEAQIVDLVKSLRTDMQMAVVWITHNLGVLAGLADRVAVMYGGAVVEEAPARELYARPRHPYTVGLLRSRPRAESATRRRLSAIPGAPPNMLVPPRGCNFVSRCEWADESCRANKPPLEECRGGRRVACHNWKRVAEGSSRKAAG